MLNKFNNESSVFFKIVFSLKDPPKKRGWLNLKFPPNRRWCPECFGTTPAYVPAERKGLPEVKPFEVRTVTGNKGLLFQHGFTLYYSVFCCSTGKNLIEHFGEKYLANLRFSFFFLTFGPCKHISVKSRLFALYRTVDLSRSCKK